MTQVYLVGSGGIFAESVIPVENEVIVGRDPKVCQLVYPGTNREVSGVHCKIQNSNGMITITDLGSTNGTFLKSGEKLSPNTPYTLQGGQGFYLGNRDNIFVIRMEEVVPQMGRELVVQPVQAAAQPKQNRGALGIVVAIAIVAVGLIAVIAIGSINKARLDVQQAQQEAEWGVERARQQMEIELMEQELYDEQNKGLLEKVFDVGDDLIDTVSQFF